MVNYLVGFASQMLLEAGEFYPLAALVNREGTVEALGAHTGEERQQSADVYQLLVQGLKARVEGGDAIAIGIAVDVNIPPPFESPLPDGVRITLETEGNSRLIYFPYEPAKGGLVKKTPPRFAEPFAVETPSDFFANPTN